MLAIDLRQWLLQLATCSVCCCSLKVPYSLCCCSVKTLYSVRCCSLNTLYSVCCRSLTWSCSIRYRSHRQQQSSTGMKHYIHYLLWLCLQVKIWNVQSGFCYVTFSDHTAPVTAVAFLPSGSVVVSASLDGTVRAFDLVRYRNFRTMTSPHPVQFVSLAVDPAGEVSCHSIFLASHSLTELPIHLLPLVRHQHNARRAAVC